MTDCNNFSAALADRCWKEHECRFCGAQFTYVIRQQITADGKTAEDAQKTLDQKITRQIEKLVEPIPCPVCGEYQPEMLYILKQRFWGFFMFAGLSLPCMIMLLSLTGWLSHEFSINSLIVGLLISIPAHIAMRNPAFFNDKDKNLRIAAKYVKMGNLLILRPGRNNIVVRSVDENRVSLKGKAACIFTVIAMIAAAAVPVWRIANNIQLNDKVLPSVAVPDQTVQFRFGQTIQGIKGLWRGEGLVEIEGYNGSIDSRSAKSYYSQEINLPKSQADSPVPITPWLSFVIPSNPDLANKNSPVKITLNTKAPLPDQYGKYIEGSRTLTDNFNIIIASKKEGEMYFTLWNTAFLIACLALLATLLFVTDTWPAESSSRMRTCYR